MLNSDSFNSDTNFIQGNRCKIPMKKNYWDITGVRIVLINYFIQSLLL